MDPVDLLGRWVDRSAAKRPDRARALLEAAYSAVALKGRLTGGRGVVAAQDRCNGAIASMVAGSLRRPGTSCVVNIFLPCELLHASGAAPMIPEVMSVYVACTRCAEGFCERAEAAGVPESFCSYHKLMLGMEDVGVMGAPALVANTTLACDANQVSFRALAAAGGVPRAVIDVPHTTSEDDVAYVADQLRDLAGTLSRVMGTPVDDDLLRETCRRSRRTLEGVQRFCGLRSRCSLPTTLTSELCMLVCTHVLLGAQAAEDFVGDMVAEAEAAVAAGHREGRAASVSSVPRVFWIHTLPNWQQAMGSIFDGAAAAELVGNDMAYDFLGVLDALDPERPYDFMARRLVFSTSNGTAARRVEAALVQARQAGADGAILFGHWGCKQTLGLAGVAERAFCEAGVPLLVLSGDGCDPRNAPSGQMVTRVEAFLESLS
ncbi:2-hydroxyacyl-CoA dehydratase family protein [Atopobiaceae bacterium 24-176]